MTILWKIEPKEVLYEFEEPLIFTFEREGELFLGYRTAPNEGVDTLLAVRTTNEEINRLKLGEMPVLDALSKAVVYELLQVYQNRSSWMMMQVLEKGMDSVPEGNRPVPGVTLFP